MRSLCVFLLLGLSVGFAIAVPFDEWQQRYPLPTGIDLRSVAFGNGRFVAMGGDPIQPAGILTSSDGDVWVNHGTSTNEFSKITFGNGTFVGVGYDGLLTSVDGIQWTPRESVYFSSVAWVHDRFFASRGDIIFRSFDGITWSGIWTNGQSAFTGITYGNGRFVAVGQSRVSDESWRAAVLSSTNGEQWSTQNVANLPPLTDVEFGNGMFAAFSYGRAWYSEDGMTWFEAGAVPNFALWDVTFADGTFVAVGDGNTILTSGDARSWTKRDADTLAAFRSVAYAQGKFVTVGSGGSIVTSTDKINWLRRNKGTLAKFFDSTHANGIFVAVGGRTPGDDSVNGAIILTSSNGMNWAEQNFDSPLLLAAITHGNGIFVAGGNGGTVMTSIDAKSWSVHDTGRSDVTFHDAVYQNGQFVLIGSGFRRGVILTSVDGIAWTLRHEGPDQFLYGVTSAKGLFVAVGGNILHVVDPSTVLTSPDGITWTPRPSNTWGVLTGVAYGNGLFVATRYENLNTTNMIITSSDGITWKEASTGYSMPLNDVAFGGGSFVAVGLSGQLLTSTNGIHWALAKTYTSQPLRSAAYGADSFVAVGDRAVLQSINPVLRFHSLQVRMTNGIMRLVGETPVGDSIRIEATSDLQNWTPLTTISNSSGMFEFADPPGQRAPARFYRLNRVSP